jgi:hypothetical protein
VKGSWLTLSLSQIFKSFTHVIRCQFLAPAFRFIGGIKFRHIFGDPLICLLYQLFNVFLDMAVVV